MTGTNVEELLSKYNRWALISVTNRTGLTDLVRGFERHGVGAIASTGTGDFIKENAGVEYLHIVDYTGVEEMMGGRLKTYHHKVLGGVVGREVDKDTMAKYSMLQIDFTIVNFYDFAGQAAKKDGTLAAAVEAIDIGGPAINRAAGKNFLARTTPVVDPADYASILSAMDANNGIVPRQMRLEMAAKLFLETSVYDRKIAAYLFKQARNSKRDRRDTEVSEPQ